MAEELSLNLVISGQDQASAAIREADASLKAFVSTLKAADREMKRLGASWATSLDKIAADARAAVSSVSVSVDKMQASTMASSREIKATLAGTFSPLGESADMAARESAAAMGRMSLSVKSELDGIKASMADAFAPLSASATAATDMLAAGMGKINTAVTEAMGQVRALAAEMRAINVPGEPGSNSGLRNAARRDHGGGHAIVRAGERGIEGVSGILPFAVTPGMAAAGALAGSAYEAIEQGHEIAKTIESGLDPKELGLSKEQFTSRLQADAAALGESVEEVAKSYAAGARILQGIDPMERFALIRKVLRPAEFESQVKGVDLPESVTSFIAMAHQMGEYRPDETLKLAQQFSAASLATKASLDEITNTSSYFLPQLHATLGLDAATGLSMMLAGKNAGLGTSKAGTNLRAFESNLFATGQDKHDDELKKLGLLTKDGKPAWTVMGTDGKTDWLKSNIKAGEILQKSIGALPEDERMKALKESMGEQGGRFASLMASPAFREQISGIKRKIDAGSEGDQLGRLQGEDPMQAFRQSWSELKNVLADLGVQILPSVLTGLEGFNKILQAIDGELKGGLFNISGKSAGEKFWRFVDPGLADRIYGAADRPDTQDDGNRGDLAKHQTQPQRWGATWV